MALNYASVTDVKRKVALRKDFNMGAIMETAVLQIPTLTIVGKREKAGVPKRRRPRNSGCLWKPTYHVKDANGNQVPRKSATWWARYIDPTTGKRVNENTHFEGKEGAQGFLNKKLNLAREGELSEFEKYKTVTLKQITDLVREDYRVNNRNFDRVERSLKLLEEFFGANRLINVNPVSDSAYREHRRKMVSKPNEQTINRDLAVLRRAFYLGLEKGLVRKVPNFSLPNERNRVETGWFGPGDFETLMQGLKPRNGMEKVDMDLSYLEPLARFLYKTGMRINEALGITWGEITFTTMGVNGATAPVVELRIPGRRTKNGEQKVLYLAGDVLKVIHGLAAKDGNGDAVKPKNDGPVFRRNSEPIRYDSALNHFDEAFKRSGLRDLLVGRFKDADGNYRKASWHDFRRSFARNADAAGVPRDQIKAIAGWETDEMLERYLGKARPEAQVLAFQRTDVVSSGQIS